MRLDESYRGARRNILRSQGNLRRWRELGHAMAANLRALLPDRRKQCEAARTAWFTAPLKGLNAAKALLTYWLEQKRTRVVSRILRQLDPRVA